MYERLRNLILDPTDTTAEGMIQIGFKGETPESAAELFDLIRQILQNESAMRVIAERMRQIREEGWTPEHDAQHSHGELASAAACYAEAAGCFWPKALPITAWPWDMAWWKPGDKERMLEKAGALILAELDRIRTQKPQ